MVKVRAIFKYGLAIKMTEPNSTTGYRVESQSRLQLRINNRVDRDVFNYELSVRGQSRLGLLTGWTIIGDGDKRKGGESPVVKLKSIRDYDCITIKF